jgi:hypothetical protein
MSLCVYALSIILSARYARIELALPQTEWVRQQQKRVPLRTYPETGRDVVEWRRAEQEFKGEERDEQNETVGSQ